MDLNELIPAPNSKKIAELSRKTFGYAVDLDNLNTKQRFALKNSIGKQITIYENKLGNKVISNRNYYELKLNHEALVKAINEDAYDDLSEEANELVLYAENDSDLYERSYVPIAKNLTKKYKKGIYEHKLAIKLWKYHADKSAKSYGADHGNDDGFQIFSPKDRMLAARYFAESWMEELQVGNAMESKVDEGFMPDEINGAIDGFEFTGDDGNETMGTLFYEATIDNDEVQGYTATIIPESLRAEINEENNPGRLDDAMATESVQPGGGDHNEAMFHAQEDAQEQIKSADIDPQAYESKSTKKNIVTEGQLEGAELTLAAKDMVDRVQGMLEDLGEMLNEDLAPLVDAVRDEMGTEIADQFSAAMSASIGQALEDMRVTRESTDVASRILMGEAPAEMMGADEIPMEPTTDMDTEMGEMPPDEAGPPEEDFAMADAAEGGEAELGREKRA